MGATKTKTDRERRHLDTPHHPQPDLDGERQTAPVADVRVDDDELSRDRAPHRLRALEAGVVRVPRRVGVAQLHICLCISLVEVGFRHDHEVIGDDHYDLDNHCEENDS